MRGALQGIEGVLINPPLYGWRVLVPRTKEQAAAMSARLAGYGASPQSVPTISVEPPRNPAQMDRAIETHLIPLVLQVARFSPIEPYAPATLK